MSKADVIEVEGTVLSGEISKTVRGTGSKLREGRMSPSHSPSRPRVWWCGGVCWLDKTERTGDSYRVSGSFFYIKI